MLKYILYRFNKIKHSNYKRFGFKTKSKMGQGLKHVGGNIRKGISGISGSVLSKSKGFGQLKKNKFASADNVSSYSRNSSSIDEETSQYETAQRTMTGAGSALSLHASSSTGFIKCSSDPASENTSLSSEILSDQQDLQLHISDSLLLEPIFTELQNRREQLDKMQEEVELIKQTVQQEISVATQALCEQRAHCERLEVQVLDLSRLHHIEFQHLKQTITDTEEKVQYQREERLSEIRDMLECCQNKLSKMELQQQQYVSLDGIDNSNARVLVVKLINVVLTLMQLVLLLFATVAGITMPFLCTRLRILSTVVLVTGAVLITKYWHKVFMFENMLPYVNKTSVT